MKSVCCPKRRYSTPAPTARVVGPHQPSADAWRALTLPPVNAATTPVTSAVATNGATPRVAPTCPYLHYVAFVDHACHTRQFTAATCPKPVNGNSPRGTPALAAPHLPARCPRLLPWAERTAPHLPLRHVAHGTNGKPPRGTPLGPLIHHAP